MELEELKYSDVTRKIIGCAMTVHTELGNGFQEVIYQRALAIEMRKQAIEFDREFEMAVYYSQEQIGTRRVDFLVNKVISVEIKAVSVLDNREIAQALNYLEAYNLEVGLLLNFGEKSLKFKRLKNLKVKTI